MDKGPAIMPPPESIDPRRIEFVLDLDLDEFTVLLDGPEHEAYADPASEVMSYLRDLETGDVVGVVFSRFTSQVLREVPELRELALGSTIIIGDFVGSLESLDDWNSMLAGMVRATLSASGDPWDPRDDAEQVRGIVRDIRAFG